ncbi:MAG TPA: TIGR04211 family SH3 domain-containing protein [Candidatus Methylomirabilis sp.]|nr:TIGR04211 family SH3 domain-containing protein [Candidatus Methylomirabilis sp.]
MNSLRIVAAVAMLAVVSVARAETLYVAERLVVGLRAEASDTGPTVKTVETGTPLEVLERQDRFVHVRDQQGTDGWVEARYLTTDPPVRLQLAALQQDLTKSRAQTADAQAQLKKAQATVAEQSAQIAELERNAAEKAAAPPPVAPAPAPEPVMGARPGRKTAAAEEFQFSFVWLAISFAMLGVGFAGGILWLRESIRRRSGGMYLRV